MDDRAAREVPARAPGSIRPHLGWPSLLALSLLAGLLICFALPPWGWWFLAPLGIALWVWLLDGEGIWRRAGIGWLVGIGWFGPSTLWMWGLTEAGYPPGVLFGWGTMVAATSAVVPGDRRRLLVLPAALVAYEWLHSHGPFGGVPLSLLGMTQVDLPTLAIARLGGVFMVGAVVSALGVAVYLVAVERAWKPALGVLAAIAALSALGALWPTGNPVGELTIASVQGGGPQGTRYATGEEPEVFARHLQATQEIPDDADVDVVVWPENSINVGGDFLDHAWYDEIATQAARIGAPIVVGVVDDLTNPDGTTDDERFENYVLVVNPDGSTGDRFDKERRVPFGEYVPLRSLFETVAGGNLPARDAVVGEGTAVVEADGVPMAVVISWEVFFPRRVREGVREGGQVVLNPTNGSSFWLTQVQTQQVVSSRFRAVESGRWVLQVAPTGFSAFVDPDGGVHDRTDISERAVTTRTVGLYDSTTPAQALGATPVLLLAAVAVVTAQVLERRSRKPVNGDRPTPT
ncbi:MAG: apolipoprotein N-acyltransferase [Microthrixaceae bacterium]